MVALNSTCERGVAVWGGGGRGCFVKRVNHIGNGYVSFQWKQEGYAHFQSACHLTGQQPRVKPMQIPRFHSLTNCFDANVLQRTRRPQKVDIEDRCQKAVSVLDNTQFLSGWFPV